MKTNYKQLLAWFPSGTAEGEKAILEQVFVYVDEFSSIIDPPEGSPHLLVGSKGSGKSAVMDFAARLLARQETPSVFITPFDIKTDDIGEGASTGDMARKFAEIIVAAIAAKLSETSTGWFDGDYAVLYREAVDKSLRSPDFVTRMVRFIGAVAKPLAKVDLNAAFPHLTQATRKDIEGALVNVLQSQRFYLFIDDTDQIAHPDKPGHLNRIWSLLLAVRKLASDMPNLKAIVSLRAEVWERLQFDPKAQRDQTDHFRNLCVHMTTSRNHVAKIIRRRLALAAEQMGGSEDPYSPFFEGVVAKAPYSPDPRSWEDLVVVRSRQRPRDAIQLINSLAKSAERDPRKPEKIDELVFQSVIPPFSEEIAEDFAKEVSLECPQMLDIIRSFSQLEFDAGGFTLTTEAVRDHLKSMITMFGVQIYGVPISQGSEEHLFELWRYLFTSGFLNARVSDDREKDSYRHVDPLNERNFVSKSRWNSMQATLWEINPAYRDFMIKVQSQRLHQHGLARKRPRRGRRRP